MDYQVSARKYRPTTFQDVMGQGHVVQTLVNAIASKRIAHAFLFSGTRGVGKTTVARIVAKALNCEHGPTGDPCNSCQNCQDITQGNSVDVIEIDGASNTSVDDVREVRENIKFAPFRGQYRVYIIDEVHMLSNSAFNALLKTLEEPPGHVVFVFATTEIHKIPATILSRCQHYNFRRISRSDIILRLQQVAEEEKLILEERSLAAIARASEGSMRDALSLLDQAVAFGGTKVRHSDLEILLGSVPQELIQEMIGALINQNSLKAVKVIADLIDQGHDLRAYCRDVVENIRHMLVASVVPSIEDLRGLIEGAEDELRQIMANAKGFSSEQLQELFRIFSQAEDGLRVSAHPRYVLEVAAVRATCSGQPKTNAPSQADMSDSRSLNRQGERNREEGARHPSAVAREEEKKDPVPPSSRITVADGPSHAQQEQMKDPPVAVRIEGNSGLTQTGAPSRKQHSSTQTRDSVSHDKPVSPIESSTAPMSKSYEQSHPEVSPKSNIDWDKIVEKIGDSHPAIAPFLERGVFVKFEKDVVTLGFPKTEQSARGMIEKKDNLTVLNELCMASLGRAVRIRITELLDGQQGGKSRAQVRAEKVQDQKVTLLEQTRAHPFVKQVLHEFGGEVVDVREKSPSQEVSE